MSMSLLVVKESSTVASAVATKETSAMPSDTIIFTYEKYDLTKQLAQKIDRMVETWGKLGCIPTVTINAYCELATKSTTFFVSSEFDDDIIIMRGFRLYRIHRENLLGVYT